MKLSPAQEWALQRAYIGLVSNAKEKLAQRLQTSNGDGWLGLARDDASRARDLVQAFRPIVVPQDGQ